MMTDMIFLLFYGNKRIDKQHTFEHMGPGFNSIREERRITLHDKEGP